MKTTRSRYESNQRSAVQLRPFVQVKQKKICTGKKKKGRTEQDSNLRGQSPLDFESNALTTRPSVQATTKKVNIAVLFLYTMQVNPDNGMQRPVLRMEVPKRTQIEKATPEELILPPVIERQ